MSRTKADADNEQGAPRAPRHGLWAVGLAGIAVAMVGASFAAVPLYRIFCQVTGYAGTIQRAGRPAGVVLGETMTVRFDSNVVPTLPWRFQPRQRSVTVKIGEPTLIYYRAENLSARDITGTATFNVTPAIVGSYFRKIECFCFTEQTLKAGEGRDMPVTFFIDPSIMDDSDAKAEHEVTLSYTFFPSGKPPGLAAKASEGKGS